MFEILPPIHKRSGIIDTLCKLSINPFLKHNVFQIFNFSSTYYYLKIEHLYIENGENEENNTTDPLIYNLPPSVHDS